VIIIIIAVAIIAAVSYFSITYESSPRYQVTFQQQGACSPSVYVVPWAVTLGGALGSQVKAEPTNASLPIPDDGYGGGPEPPSIYTIVFTVHDGLYRWTVAPSDAFYYYTGTVTVSGANVTTTLDGPEVSCSTSA
jgi:hypothetical protein